MYQPDEMCLHGFFFFLIPLSRRLSCLAARDALESKLHHDSPLPLVTKTEDVIPGRSVTAEGLTRFTYPNWQSARPRNRSHSQITLSFVIYSKTQGSTMHVHWFTALSRPYFKSIHSESGCSVHANFRKGG